MIHKEELFQAERVLFITTKNIDYIRNSQEIEYLQQYSRMLELIYSEKKLYFTRVIEVFLKLILKDCTIFDMVFVGFSPQLILPFFNRKFKGKIYIDFFISIYDTLVCDRKTIKDNSFFSNICKWFDRKTLLLADKVVVDTLEHGKYFAEEFGINEKKFNVLYLQADKKIYYPKTMQKQKFLKNKFVVLYFGSILPLQGVDIILKAVTFLEKEKDIWFQIIGPIREKIAKGHNVEYIQWLTQDELSDYISSADLCLAGHFNKNIEKANRTVPGKAYIYEAMEKKMILGDSMANREYFIEDENHIFVERGNDQELAKVLKVEMKKWKRKTKIDDESFR